MTQQQDWKKWRTQEFKILGESIAWAAHVFNTTGVGIEKSRHYGAALLAHSIECARAIRLCVKRGVPGPAFSLARVQYEGSLRGHIIIHEIELEELNAFLGRIQRWQQKKQRKTTPPMIQIKDSKWMCGGARTRPKWRPLKCEIAKLFVGSVLNAGLINDLTHSGMTQALQMFDENGLIEPNYSDLNQTLLLNFADKAVMFAIMTWPGSEQKYCREIEQRVEDKIKLRSKWEPQIGIRSS